MKYDVAEIYFYCFNTTSILSHDCKFNIFDSKTLFYD